MNRDMPEKENVKRASDALDTLYERVSRGEDAYEAIKSGIVAGKWKPGDRINDQVVSEQLGVSRTSVREALSKLAENRIVDRVHWKGFFVREISMQEIEAIVDIRIALERLALRDLMERESEGLVKRLESAIETSERLLMAGTHEDYMAADFQFHQIIYEESGNPWIPVIISNLTVFLHVVRNISMLEHFSDAAEASIRDHRRMLRLIQDGDLEGLLKEFDQHMQTHRRNIRAEYDTYLRS